MEIICMASSSAGNAYVIKNTKTTLLVECGLPFPILRMRLLKHGIQRTDISAVVITHKHGDHARCASELSEATMIVASKETLDASGVQKNRWPLRSWESVIYETIKITAFELDHDCDGTFGYIFQDQESNQSILFINDTQYVKWNFKKYQFTYIMIECNHNTDMIINKTVTVRRVAKSHMSLEATKKTLATMDLTKTRAIYLMHLSDGSSDQERMINEIRKQTGRPTYACLKDGGTT